jgi:hypothetical protein
VQKHDELLKTIGKLMQMSYSEKSNKDETVYQNIIIPYFK